MSERIFCIGNGPSLASVDLDRLIPETTFGMNLIHKIYPTTDWRPTHYMFSDHPQYLEHAEELLENHIHQGSYDVWLRDDVMEICCGEYVPTFGKPENFIPRDEMPDRVHEWPRCSKHVAMNYLDDNRPTEFCTRFLEEGLFCKFGSGMNAILQHAISWGYEDIILLGCDVNYTVDRSGAGDPNHFSKDYHPAGFWDEEAVSVHDATIRYAHSLVADWAAENGVRIRNASGGDLEAYERIDLDDVLP